jgi:hypothetical protein
MIMLGFLTPRCTDEQRGSSEVAAGTGRGQVCKMCQLVQSFKYIFLFFLFGSAGDGTQDLVRARQTVLPLSSTPNLYQVIKMLQSAKALDTEAALCWRP